MSIRNTAHDIVGSYCPFGLVVEMMSNGDVQVINASKYFCSEESNEIQIAGNRLCLRNAYRAKMFLNPVMGSATRIRFFVDIIPRAINQL